MAIHIRRRELIATRSAALPRGRLRRARVWETKRVNAAPLREQCQCAGNRGAREADRVPRPSRRPHARSLRTPEPPSLAAKRDWRKKRSSANAADRSYAATKIEMVDIGSIRFVHCHRVLLGTKSHKIRVSWFVSRRQLAPAFEHSHAASRVRPGRRDRSADFL
jgi:hypothetical protein